jgi:hypothetical protein
VVVEPALRVVGFRPDVVVTDDAGALLSWVECGDVGAHKLDRLGRALGDGVALLVVKQAARAAAVLRRALATAAHPSRVVVAVVEPAAVAALGAALAPHHRVSLVATLDDDGADAVRLDLHVGDVAVAARVRLLVHGDGDGDGDGGGGDGDGDGR